APRLPTNRMRNSQSDHQPRLLLLKRAQRRWLMGDRSIGLLPVLEVDAQIDQGVDDIADQLHDQPEQGEDEQRAED
ncbi:hypothetical protein SC81_23020, partial [Vibrio vulnificus]